MSFMGTLGQASELRQMLERVSQTESDSERAFGDAVDSAFAAKQQRIDFALAVKTAREAAGLSQRKLAKIVGMQQNDLSRLEKFKTNPTSDTQAKLRHALGIRVTYEVTGVLGAEVTAAAKSKRELPKSA
jgi:ribosome-binding protein aMBF1 (putative translation factor)